MVDQSDNPPAAVYDLAFAEWWDRDYSWDGLAKHKIFAVAPDNPRDAMTLQHYWAAEKGHLVKFAGRRWTKFHLPLHDRNGNPSPKANWSKRDQDALSSHLIKLATEAGAEAKQQLDKFDQEGGKWGAWAEFPGPKCAQLNGVVIPALFRIPPNTPLSVSFDRAIFWNGALFGGAQFDGYAFFHDAIFKDFAYFDSARFIQGGHFTRSLFTSDAIFVDSVFEAPARFFDAKFMAPAIFAGAEFRGERSGTFFSRASFYDIVEMRKTKFAGFADFDHTHFYKLAEFWEANFGWKATFEKAIFDGEAHFHSGIGKTEFGGPVNFTQVIFKRDADFSGRMFRRETDFSLARFCSAPLFHGADLHPNTSFLKTEFPSVQGEPLWKKEVGDEEGEEVDEDRPRLAVSILGRFVRTIVVAIDNIKLRLRKLIFGLPFGDRLPSMKDLRTSRDKATENLESAYRTLRISAVKRGNSEQEGMFYALEMDSRRNRTDVPLFERMIAVLFKFSSNYGQDTHLPLLWLALAMIAAPTIVYLLLPGLGYKDVGFESVAGFVERQFFPPPTVWSGREMGSAPAWAQSLYERFNLVVVIGASFLSLLTISLLAVFLITLRRRFALK
jgi:hypothetical protein